MDKKLIIIIVVVLVYFAFTFIKGRVMKSELSEKNKDEYVLLDVRTVEETKLGMLEDAINIPVDELASKLESLDKNKEIYVYCRSGARASTAVNILTKNGYKAKNIGGYESLKNQKP